jgi:hypothetical protein
MNKIKYRSIFVDFIITIALILGIIHSITYPYTTKDRDKAYHDGYVTGINVAEGVAIETIELNCVFGVDTGHIPKDPGIMYDINSLLDTIQAKTSIERKNEEKYKNADYVDR